MATLRKNNKEVVGVSRGRRLISYIYKGIMLIWSAIRSCFGNGYWVNTMPWSNEDAWKNNK